MSTNVVNRNGLKRESLDFVSILCRPRFMVFCTGVYRFKVSEWGPVRDGYVTGTVERIEDADGEDEIIARAGGLEIEDEEVEEQLQEPSKAAGSQGIGSDAPQPGTQSTTSGNLASARSLLQSFISALPQRNRLSFEQEYGTIPTDDEGLTWFLANLLLSGEEERVRSSLLKTKSVKRRAKVLMPLVQERLGEAGMGRGRCSLM